MNQNNKKKSLALIITQIYFDITHMKQDASDVTRITEISQVIHDKQMEKKKNEQ